MASTGLGCQQTREFRIDLTNQGHPRDIDSVGRRQRLEFKASFAIRVAVVAALLVWLGVGILGVWVEVPASSLLAVAFFVTFFLGFAAHYGSMAYVLDEYGVTVRGATEFSHYPWEDIVNVRDSELPLGGYVVSTKGGAFVLSTFVHDRKLLLDTIVARAGLFPEFTRS